MLNVKTIDTKHPENLGHKEKIKTKIIGIEEVE